MYKNKFLAVLLCIIMVIGSIGIAGCSNGSETPEEPEAPEVQDISVKLYFANEEYIASGDQALEKFMPVYETTIPGDSENPYLDTLEALKTVPEKGYESLITEQIKFLDVYVEGNTAFVDLNQEGLSGGSLSEIYLISQTVKTLTDSFEEIKEVQFLVNGEIVESLMGHFDASKPFTNDTFSE